MALLQLQDLSKSYIAAGARHAIIRDLQLTVRAGERIAVLGRSGSGKSTLLNLIAGLDRPDNGAIVFEEQDLCAFSDKQRTLWRRKAVGFIFQFFNLIPTLTVKENLLLPLELVKAGRERQRWALSQLQALGLGHYQDYYPDQLSGGEQQRVAILRALAHQPRLILADEPTGNLDHDTGNQVARCLFDAVNHRSALLLVTHSEEIAAKADRIYTLQDGVLRDGP